MKFLRTITLIMLIALPAIAVYQSLTTEMESGTLILMWVCTITLGAIGVYILRPREASHG